MCRIDQVLGLHNHVRGRHLLHPVLETENFDYLHAAMSKILNILWSRVGYETMRFKL